MFPLPHVPGVLPRMNVCDEANALVTGERQRAYGGPTEALTGSPPLDRGTRYPHHPPNKSRSV
jgi:hypothetical protein